MKKRNKRVLWLLNHKTLMPYEVNLMIELGFEVFTPKIIPNSPSFRSGYVDFSYDSTLTIPSAVLEQLNNFNFYEEEWPTIITFLVNRYFGTVYIIPHGKQVAEALEKFEGQIMFRAFGLDKTLTYKLVLSMLYGDDIFYKILKAGSRFWFASGYEQLYECEPEFLIKQAIFLPLGVPKYFWKTVDSYIGTDKRILFVCPNCVTNSYYADIYKKFKAEFGDLPHVIVGAQDVPVDDRHVLGFVSNEELVRLYQECALIYYHSTEPRHVHYSPIEAAINGMPVVYYADSLLGKMTPEIKYGRVQTFKEARATAERILVGDAEFITAIRADQKLLAYKFSDEYCKAQWKRSFLESGYECALLSMPESLSCASIMWLKFKKSALFDFIAHKLLHLPKKYQFLGLEQLIHAQSNDINDTIFKNGICFANRNYPWYVFMVKGMSSDNEELGRWSDKPEIEIIFYEKLPKKFNLVIQGYAYGPNIGKDIKVKIGSVVRFFKFSASREIVSIEFSLKQEANSIKILVPKPVIPPNDVRRIGVRLFHLKIELDNDAA